MSTYNYTNVMAVNAMEVGAKHGVANRALHSQCMIVQQGTASALGK